MELIQRKTPLISTLHRRGRDICSIAVTPNFYFFITDVYSEAEMSPDVKFKSYIKKDTQVVATKKT